PRVEQGDLAAYRVDAGSPADLRQERVGPGARRQQEPAGFPLADARLDRPDVARIALEAVHRTTGTQPDAVRCAAGKQRSEVPRIAELGHVRQEARTAQAGSQGRLQTAERLLVQHFEGDALSAPFLRGHVAPGTEQFQAAAT